MPNDKISICCIAYHDPIKGIDVLADAVHILKYKLNVKNFIIYQVGGALYPEYEKKLLGLLTRLHIEDELVFLGLRNDVDKILSGCDIYCQPSRSEGIPLSIMEAMIAKLPVVATNVGGIPEAAHHDDTALLCEKDSPTALAQNLKIMIENEAKRLEYGKRGHMRALKDFSLSTQVERLINLYDQLYDKRI